jgi:hypothetical protein
MEDARNVSLRMRGGGCGGSKSSLSLKQVPMKALRADELTEVDLSGKGLGPEEALALGDVMKIGSKLVACNLLKNDFDVESATMLASIGEEKRIMLSGAIKHDVHEQPEVVLCRQGLRAADGILIASDLRMSNVLTSLDLCRNELCSVRDADGRDTYTAEGIKAVADALRVNPSSASLNLSNNDIGGHWDYSTRSMVSTPEGPAAIAEALKVNASLTECRLRGNNLGVEGWTVIFNALCDAPNSKITTWDLSEEYLGPEIAKPLSEYISVSASLTLLSTAYNNISGDGAQQLAAAVLAKPTLNNFSGIPLKELRADSLTTLDLKSKGLGVPEAMVLADLLRSVSASLTRLDVSWNKLDRGGNGVQLLREVVRGRDGFVLIDNDND